LKAAEELDNSTEIGGDTTMSDEKEEKAILQNRILKPGSSKPNMRSGSSIPEGFLKSGY